MLASYRSSSEKETAQLGRSCLVQIALNLIASRCYVGVLQFCASNQLIRLPFLLPNTTENQQSGLLGGYSEASAHSRLAAGVEHFIGRNAALPLLVLLNHVLLIGAVCHLVELQWMALCSLECDACRLAEDSLVARRRRVLVDVVLCFIYRFVATIWQLMLF